MKQMLKDFSNLLLVVLCDYVLGTVEYLLLEQPTHVALSNGTVSVGLQNYDGSNVTWRNLSVLLTDASTNQTVAKKQLTQGQDRDLVTFECFHFKRAGNYSFKIVSEFINGTHPQWNRKSIPLTVEWPVFHFDLRRTSESRGTSLQLVLFTDAYLCPRNETVISLDIILTSSFYELETLIMKETVGMRTRKKLDLFRSQLVTFDCQLASQEPFVAVLLKAVETNSIIASTGPINLVRKFGYKLVLPEEIVCESSIMVSVLPPPCTSAAGRITVLKYHLGPLGKRALKLHESIVNPEDKRIAFNCTLFDKGTHKYCFEFRQLDQHDSALRAKECVLIQRNVESWSLWQAWTPCSVTCGDGIRERYRECLTSLPVLTEQECVGRHREASLCSLEECTTTRSPPITPLHNDQRATNNLVTVTGISLCLSIIFATILITLWRKLCRTQKCSTPVRCDSAHSPGFRKNSDEEDICQEGQRGDSFSEREAPCSPHEEPDRPLNLRCLHFAQEEGSSANESFQSGAQKIIPPIFSYRLAQQQLKEMKKKGLTEATKVYHVSQNPLTDTVNAENQEAVGTSKFRIKSPFLEQPPGHPQLPGNRPSSMVGFAPSAVEPTWSPTQSLIKRSHPRYLDYKAEPSERSYLRSSQFRRTASFHEARKAKPFRKRSMSTLTPSQTPHYHCRARIWGSVPEEQHQSEPQSVKQNTIELDLYPSTALTTEVMTGGVQNPHRWEPLLGKQPDLPNNQQPLSQRLYADKPEQKRNRGSPLLSSGDPWRKEPAGASLKNTHQRDVLSPAQYRKSKCQSFPSDPEYHFYDNSTFGLTESEQQMIDLPGYFGSNEDGEMSTLSIENLVI
nr:thrombospondin type-1 domain-containing protein 1 isoform X1 [Pogona vitticeps]